MVGLALMLASSCTTFTASNLQVGERKTSYQILGDFSKKIWVTKFLGISGGPTLFNISAGRSAGVIEKAVMKEIEARGGTAAINIKIKWGSNPVQWFLNWLTLSIYAPTTATITGTVIKE